MRLHLKLILFLFHLFRVSSIDYGPSYKPTKGEVWPEPQRQTKQNTLFSLENKKLNITTPYHTCDILDEGIKRIIHRNLARRQLNIVVDDQTIERRDNHEAERDGNDNKDVSATSLKGLRIELTEECEDFPYLDMDEKYNLTVGETAVLSSASIWGILRGLQTFSQLIYYSDDYTELLINGTNIEDYPAYSYRGLLIDTGRHYLPVETISSTIDAMEMNKMNVLHWHIVDDQSFPYQSKRFPRLSEYGAFYPSMVYTKEDVQRIIKRGRLAGIRVIPEFDVPGHVRSWGAAFPNILTKCYKAKQVVGLGPLNPIRNETYIFLRRLYKEIKKTFPDEYIHLGGDEVDTTCWASNPAIHDYLKKHNIKNINTLQAQFMSKVKTLLPPKTKYIVWQDVFDSNVPLPNKTLIQVWRYEWVEEMDKILKAGHRVIFSSSWYLDEINKDWDTFYRADPRNMVYIHRFNATGLQDIVGGEACMWGERVDNTNFFPRIWPRASAVAERLWTGMDYTNILPIDPVTIYARRRIEEHTCRMRQNGIPAQPPNGPGFCIGADSQVQYYNRRSNTKNLKSIEFKC